MVKTIGVLLILLVSAGTSQAKEPVSTIGSYSYISNPIKISTNNAILSIVGEAEGEGYIGMLAVAHAIRNRGHLRGVYGRTSKRVLKHLYSQSSYNMAMRAWNDSLTTDDLTHGATHWDNIGEFGVPNWSDSMTLTIKIGNHTFYKEK